MRIIMVLVLCVVAGTPIPGIAAKSFTLTVERNATCNKGETTGRLLVGEKEVAKSLELPWKNNEQKISRIPEGTYGAKIRQDGKLGWRIELGKIKDRENVQIHVGNDSSDTIGCILVGTALGSGNNSCVTQNSKDALGVIAAEMQKASDNGVSSQPLDITVMVK